jgi:hypothetical protein
MFKGRIGRVQRISRLDNCAHFALAKNGLFDEDQRNAKGSRVLFLWFPVTKLPIPTKGE